MKMSALAKSNGVSCEAAWATWKAGKLPVRAEQFPTGTIVVHLVDLDADVDLALPLPKKDRRRVISEVVKAL